MVHLIAPDDFDPDDALDTQWFREHDGAPALEMPHPEQEAYKDLMAMGWFVRVADASHVFARELACIESDRRYDDDHPY